MLYGFILYIFQNISHTWRARQRENLIKPDIYFITFNLWNNEVKIKVIKNKLLACTCEGIFRF